MSTVKEERPGSQAAQSAAVASSPTNAFDVLRERGFIQQATDEEAVRDLFGAGPVSVYVGFDPTAPSLHVGNLFSLMALKNVERCGHRPVVVLGGGTAMVGDPSGKTELRKMLTREQIAANLGRIRGQVAGLLGVDAGTTRVVDNGEWLLSLSYVDFLRNIGRHFSVNRMLSAEAYRARLERGLSFIEFNYQLLQAYDFLELRRRHDVRLQMGGDDQWGNILAGVDLCRRVDGELVQGLTTPLLTTATGDKMGKTAAGAIWLDPQMLSPYDYYQYWVNVHDDDVSRLLGYYTLLPMAEVREVATHGGAELNAAKSVLAYEATALLHGAEAATEAHAAAQGAFGGRTIASSILPSSQVPRQKTEDVAQIPTTQLSPARLEQGIAITALLQESGLVSSKSEARRLIQQGAVKVDDTKISDPFHLLSPAALCNGAFTLRVGKKKVHRFVLG